MSSILKRKLYIIGEISEAAYRKFSIQLSNREAQSLKDIEVELMSEGGDPIVALAFAGRIKSSKCNINITALGQVASAAVVILAAGDHRRMQANCWLMMHEDSAGLEGEVSQLERATKHLRRLEDQWSKVLFQYTGTAADIWTKLHKHTTYLSAGECKDHKIVDEII